MNIIDPKEIEGERRKRKISQQKMAGKLEMSMTKYRAIEKRGDCAVSIAKKITVMFSK